VSDPAARGSGSPGEAAVVSEALGLPPEGGADAGSSGGGAVVLEALGLSPEGGADAGSLGGGAVVSEALGLPPEGGADAGSLGGGAVVSEAPSASGADPGSSDVRRMSRAVVGSMALGREAVAEALPWSFAELCPSPASATDVEPGSSSCAATGSLAIRRHRRRMSPGCAAGVEEVAGSADAARSADAAGSVGGGSDAADGSLRMTR
jgi:hypothetical protein